MMNKTYIVPMAFATWRTIPTVPFFTSPAGSKCAVILVPFKSIAQMVSMHTAKQ